MRKNLKNEKFLYVVFFCLLTSVSVLHAQELVPIQDSKDLLAILSEQETVAREGVEVPFEKEGDHSIQERYQDTLNLPKGGKIDLYQTMIKMVSYLSIILAGVILILYCMKRFLGSSSGLNGKGKLIKVLASQSLGPKKMISLVEVSGSLLVLGVTQQGITLLSHMAPPTQASRMPLREWVGKGKLPTDVSQNDFSQELQRQSDGLPPSTKPVDLRNEKIDLETKPKTDGWLNSDGPEKGLSSTVKSLQGSLSKFKEGWG